MVDNNVQRCHWNLARVESVNYSNDGLVRSVVVKAKNKSYFRPLSKLVMLLENQGV